MSNIQVCYNFAVIKINEVVIIKWQVFSLKQLLMHGHGMIQFQLVYRGS